MAMFRIERRREGQATEYWNDGIVDGIRYRISWWALTADAATIYTEAQRRAALNGWLLPPEGCWVRLDDAQPTTNYVAPSSMPPSIAFTIYHLALVRLAVAAVIADGDPSTPRVNGKPVWSTDWQLYAAGKAEAFVEAVAARVVVMVAGTSGDDKGDNHGQPIENRPCM